MKVKDIRAMDDAAIQKELLESLREQFNMRMQNATGQLGSPAQLKKVRRNIARLYTIINENKMAKSA